MFFRLEEVILASTAAPVDDSFFGEDLRDVPAVGLKLDPLGAVGASVVQPDLVFAVLAVDQQQEVDGSRDAESFTAVQSHRMERKPQSVQKPAVVLGQ